MKEVRMSAAEEKRELLAHVEIKHPNLHSMAMPLVTLREMHDVSHWSEHHDHDHDHDEDAPSMSVSETPASTASTDKEFKDFVEAEVQRKMAETNKRYEAGWQRIVGCLQNAGMAKAQLDVARRTSNNVMMAAANFRKQEAELSSAIASMIELIAKEHG